MNIFISWSGELSHAVAVTLRDWLPSLFPTIKPFVSSEDISKGRLWFSELQKNLVDGGNALFCLTPENMDAPWLNFEAGAFANRLDETSLFTLLVGGLTAAEVRGPLQHFQHTKFEIEDVRRLVHSINLCAANAAWNPARLDAAFDRVWSELEIAIQISTRTNRRVVQISSLGRDHFNIVGRQYQDVRFLGPGIIHVERSSMIDCSFGGDRAHPDLVFWPMTSSHGAYVGLLVFSNCSFLRCSFEGIGIADYPDRIRKFLASTNTGVSATEG